jgi:hypothetical protein
MTPPETRRPIVYLIAQPTASKRKAPLDLSPLYVHGDVQVVLPMSDSPSFQPLRCYKVMARRLEQFDPEVDFLVWAGGDTLSAVMVGMILINFEVPIWRFKWLRYERHRHEDGTRTDQGAKYVPVIVDLCSPQIDLLEETEP